MAIVLLLVLTRPATTKQIRMAIVLILVSEQSDLLKSDQVVISGWFLSWYQGASIPRKVTVQAIEMSFDITELFPSS